MFSTVLSIGDTVEEVLDSGFLATAPSLLISLMADDSHIQIHPSGIRHLLPKRTSLKIQITLVG